MTDDRTTQLRAVAQRELDAVVRTPTALAPAVAFVLAIVGLAALGGTAGYLPLVLSLATPVEVLAPVLAVALGYRAILADAERGELAVVRTYPVPRGTYVAGVFLGRGIVLAGTVLLALGAAGLLVPLTASEPPAFVAAHGTVDDPVYFLRFVALSVGYALVALAVALAVSAVARSARQGLALAAVTGLLLAVGLDLAVLGGVTTGLVSEGTLAVALAASPASAFRGLVLAVAASPVKGVGPPAPTGVLAAVGLAAWAGGAAIVARTAVWRPS